MGYKPIPALHAYLILRVAVNEHLFIGLLDYSFINSWKSVNYYKQKSSGK